LPVWVHPLASLTAWASLLVVAILWFGPLSSVVLGFLGAAILAAALDPLLSRLPGPRALAAVALGLALMAATAGLATALSWPLAGPIKNLFTQWPQIRQDVNRSLAAFSEKVGLAEPLTAERMAEAVGDFLVGEGGQRLFTRGADVLLSVLISMALVIFGSMFLLAEPADGLIAAAVGVFPTRRQAALRAILQQLGPLLRRWVVGTLTGMSIVFCASLVGYLIVGVKFPVPLAMLSGLAEVVPTVGPATAGVIAVLFTAAVDTPGKAMGVLLVWAIIQAFEAYLVLPMIWRGALRIHPAVTLFTVVLWGKTFGVAGLILAIPLNLLIWTTVDQLIVKPRGEKSGDTGHKSEAASQNPAPDY